MQRTGAVVILLMALLVGAAQAEDAFHSVDVRELGVPDPVRLALLSRSVWEPSSAPYVWVEDGEGYFCQPEAPPEGPPPRPYEALAVRAPAGREVSGRLFVPGQNDGNALVASFTLSAADASPDAEQAFWKARVRHYERLVGFRLPGSAWFRYQANRSRERLGLEAGAPPQTAGWSARRSTEIEDTYAAFTGWRAISEALALDRMPQAAEAAEETVDIDSLPGVTVPEMDWTSLTAGLEPERDPLADLVPADQYGAFFADFNAFVSVVEEARANGTPVLQLLEARSEDSLTQPFYERQLCLPLDDMARLLGPRLVRGVALTGCDPFLRMGTDLAVIFEAAQADALGPLVMARVGTAAQAAGVERREGEAAGVPYAVWRSPDRSVCSYAATVGNAVVVTNSLVQLSRLVEAWQGRRPALGSLPEYTFLRGRYARGAEAETAFVVVPDAAIRKWGSARWRIAHSRRMRAAAFLADLHARHLDELVRQTAEGRPLEAEMPLPGEDGLTLTAGGVLSATYGSLRFMTPIVELPIEGATAAEADSYRAWLRGYERGWRRVFDPIGVRFGVRPDLVTADVTVMPLTEGSQYREVMSVVGGAKVPPRGGDPHPDAVLHFVMALHGGSRPVHEAGTFMATMGMGSSPLSWLGECVALYADDSPVWDEVAEALRNDEEPPDEVLRRLPIAACAEVKDVLALAASLATMRAFVEITAPGMTVWENLDYDGRGYVRVTPSEQAREAGQAEDYAIYYCTAPQGLVVTLNEEVLKRALDRGVGPAEQAAAPWLGESMALRVRRRTLEILRLAGGEAYQDAMRRRSWGNIPILTEWHRLLPDMDPVEVHLRAFGTRLQCPGGGAYRWNEAFRTMESTVYGCPARPGGDADWPATVRAVSRAEFGVTFEHDGLRARAALRREEAPAGGKE